MSRPCPVCDYSVDAHTHAEALHCMRAADAPRPDVMGVVMTLLLLELILVGIVVLL